MNLHQSSYTTKYIKNSEYLENMYYLKIISVFFSILRIINITLFKWN